MKKLFLILLIPTIAFSKPKLKDCQEALSKCLASESIVHDTIYLHIPKTSRKDVKIAKYKAKTERKESNNTKHEAIAKLKTIKAIEISDNKVEVKTSVTYQFFSSFKAFFRSLNISQALGLGGGVSAGLLSLFGIAEKIKIFERLGIF